jgi:hypothetical protein
MKEVNPHEGHSSALRSDPQLRHLVIQFKSRIMRLPRNLHRRAAAHSRMIRPQQRNGLRSSLLQ